MIVTFAGPSKFAPSWSPMSLGPHGTVTLAPDGLTPEMFRYWQVRRMGIQGMGQTDWGTLFAGIGGASLTWGLIGGGVLVYLLLAGTKARQRRAAIKTEKTRHEKEMGEIKKKYKRL